MKNRIIQNGWTFIAINLLIAMNLLISSCANSQASASEIPERQLVFPKMDYYESLINSSHGITALFANSARGSLDSFAHEGDQTLSYFNLPNDPDCFQTIYDAYETLPDGRLQIWKSCGSGGNGTLEYLMAYDWETAQLQDLAGPLPLGSSGASWNPDQTKAVGYLDSGFATKTLFWIWQDGFGPLDLVIGDQSHSWNLQEDFPDFKADDTGKTGSTGRAAWSPDGNQIAFFASPDAVGKTSFDRFNVEYNLYLMDPVMLKTIPVADNIYSPFVLDWSSDSKMIAFVGKYGFWKENGIWIYSLDTNTVTQVSLGIYKSIVWRADKNILVAIECEDNNVCNRIIEYDLTDVFEK